MQACVPLLVVASVVLLAPAVGLGVPDKRLMFGLQAAARPALLGVGAEFAVG